MRKLQFVLLAAALAGCGSTSLSQGGKAEIVYAHDEMIRILWNPQRTNERELRSSAMAFCEGRRVEPLEATRATDAATGAMAMTWRCEPFSGTGAGM